MQGRLGVVLRFRPRFYRSPPAQSKCRWFGTRSGFGDSNINDAAAADGGHSLTDAEKSQTTSLLKSHLAPLIQMRGPLTVSDFMTHALLHPTMGYYTTLSPEDQIFGSRGDFTTAPEISQLFGELIGVWIVSRWHDMGCPQNLRLVELGPGRGTLAADVLRTVSQFPMFLDSVSAFHLVERSEALREVQYQSLADLAAVSGNQRGGTGSSNDLLLPTYWHDEFSSVPADGPCIVVAQELFDALPIHQFEYTEQGWCERLVDVDIGYSSSDDNTKDEDASLSDGEMRGSEEDPQLRFVLSPAPTNASRVYIRMFSDTGIGHNVLSDIAESGTTTVTDGKKTSLTSDGKDDGLSSGNLSPHESSPALGSRLEVCPAGCALVQDIAQRVGAHGGGALIVDYGKDRASADSLRGIRDHEFVSPLTNPGNVDLSADVDFASLRAAVESLPQDKSGGEHLRVHGTVGQGEFLKNMGVETRLHALLTGGNLNQEQQEALFASYLRLTDPEEMGRIYRVMAIVSGADESPVAGFVPPGST